MLIDENEKLKRRLRGAENLLASGTQERKQFMEGASWVAKKAQIESERHTSKLVHLVTEFENRTQKSVINPHIFEYNGQQVGINKDWIKTELIREAADLNARLQSLFENVNYQLSKAVEGFKNK